MRFLSFAICSLVCSSLPASACEGECITGVTDAFVGNYTIPVHKALSEMGKRIYAMFPNSSSANNGLDSRTLQGLPIIRESPRQNRPPNPISFFSPLISSYSKTLSPEMQKAIFPSYFHGKCQDPKTKINPKGCPNPDCPVVCGTPGSMVHFYEKLVEIAFDATKAWGDEMLAENSSTYKEVETAVLNYAAKDKGETETEKIKAFLRTIVQSFGKELENECRGATTRLERCRWEDRMKDFVLTFP